MSVLRSIMILWVLLGLSCTSAPKSLLEPKLILKEIALADATLTDSVMLFRLEIQNPNSVPLKVESIDYQIRVNKKTFEGHLDRLPKARAQSNVEVEIPLRIVLADIFDSVTLALYEKETDYGITATLKSGAFQVVLKQEGRTAVLPP